MLFVGQGCGGRCRGKKRYKFKKLLVESNLYIWLSGSIYKNTHQGQISTTLVQVETSVKFLLKFISVIPGFKTLNLQRLSILKRRKTSVQQTYLQEKLYASFNVFSKQIQLICSYYTKVSELEKYSRQQKGIKTYSNTHMIYFLQNFNFCIDIKSWVLLKESNIILGKTVLFWNKMHQK